LIKNCWFILEKLGNFFPACGPTIQEKVKQIVEIHGLNNIKASNGWLENFV